MSLRLLPAIIMDDEDDDGNFTKWMSSYWGHGAEGCGGGGGGGAGGGGHSRERKRSFRRPAKTRVDRRASLPTVSQLDAMKLNRLHAATTAPAPSHAKSREEKGEVRPHQGARRTPSDDNGRPKSAVPENRIGTIPELAESFQNRLCLQDNCSLSLNDDAKLCLLCHDNKYKSGGGGGGGGVQEPHCAHAFHKEAARRSGPCGPLGDGGEMAAACLVRSLLSGRRRSADETQQQQQQYTFRRQLSLRRHR
ncbi:leukemia NUP98 fusion partner 1 isoform X1 [Phyllopteryx taeniolatus]|uniref:leukemia NUP98 fusion partner 1 isoform X1 n=1 Tax=Phyllopteryx taeniolatus TaxID=161469 RepID=UPI002AD31AE7|nr:leukemia NUP98 fusion partner 1 isoform X1 [Phyllopteryx taeniolatus]